ncbi:hypothetical protein PV327_009063 [Microctonus hyperodae]|uniref:EGF-like domain-containing protein n=1 Tax=Microctonus hyperodae TaxID=165561 RepID=A0AA39FTE8_MICHY|nr:hypothetical protein PV327_009063 [Microctonus hyperodae]
MNKIVACFFFITFIHGTIEGSSRSLGHECDPSLIYKSCGTNERCIPKANNTYYCICKRNFVETGGECVEISTTAAASVDPSNRHTDEESTSSGSSIVVGLLIPTFLIVLGGLGCCCAKRYRLLPCQRNLYGNVLVTRDEDDDDDPPIV